MGKIFKAVYYLFLAFVAAVAVVLILSIFPIKGGVKVFVVESGSMQPAIKTGSIVVVSPAANYKIGDVITFGPVSRTKAPTTHRIQDTRVQIGQPIYITKGDANNAADTKEVAARDIIGKVRWSVPYIGYAVAAAKQPAGFAVLIIVPAGIVIFDEAKKIWREVSKMRQQKKSERT